MYTFTYTGIGANHFKPWPTVMKVTKFGGQSTFYGGPHAHSYYNIVNLRQLDKVFLNCDTLINEKTLTE